MELGETKIASGNYRIIDPLNRLFIILRADVDPDSIQRTGWNVYYVEGQMREEWHRDYASKRDALAAIIRQVEVLLQEQHQHETAVAAQITPPRTFTAVCEHCGIEYQAQRKSSRFHSAVCRVAWNRAQKAASKKDPDLFEKINELGHLVESKDYGHAAVITMINLKKAIDFFLPSLTRWWMCDVCKKQIMVFCPHENSCTCGHSAKWFIVADKI